MILKNILLGRKRTCASIKKEKKEEQRMSYISWSKMMSRNVFIYCLINLPFVIKTINTVVRIRCGSHFRNQMFLQSFTLVPTGMYMRYSTEL